MKDGTFTDVSEQVGPDLSGPRAHRGSACGDFNNDGRIDIVVTAIGEETELWENVSPVRTTGWSSGSGDQEQPRWDRNPDSAFR